MNTEDLPLLKDTKEFIKILDKELINIPRFERFTLGTAMLNHCIYLIEDLTKANRLIEKREENLNKFLSDFEPIGVILSILFENRYFSEKVMLRLGRQQRKILKQATAWRNKTHSKGNNV